MYLHTHLLQVLLVRPIIALYLLGLLSACGTTGAVVEGTITRGGKPLSGAAITLSASIAEDEQPSSTETPTAAPTFSTTTDEQGRYRFEGVDSGTKIVTLDLGVIGSPCFAMHIAEVSLGQPVTQDFAVPASLYNVSFILPDGAIISCRR